MVVHRIRLDLPQVSQLSLKSADPIQRHLEFTIVGNHTASAMISTIPAALFRV